MRDSIGKMCQGYSAATENDDPTSILMRDIIDAFARFGEKTGGEVPYGFDVDADGRLTPNQSEQETLQAITDLRSRGWTLQAICDEMEARGVMTKTGYADEGVSSVAANRDGLQLALQTLCKGTDDGEPTRILMRHVIDAFAEFQLSVAKGKKED